MNKKYIISVILIVFVGFLIFNFSNTEDKSIKEDSLILLQPEAYVDEELDFSIFLPKGWSLQSKDSTSNKLEAYFGNGSSTMVVQKFVRGDDAEQAIMNIGEEEFLVFIGDQLRYDIDGYSAISTSTVDINGAHYYNVVGTYTGKTSKKEVTQYAYVTLTEDSYYIIGMDVYSDLLEKDKDPLLESIKTFELI